ncbi:MAG: GH116 family glycosyl hydrolase, partial [Promethearchaeota archaeon]
SNWVDLTMSEILQLGRYILTNGDFELLQENWPKFLEMWAYLKQVSVNDIPEGITTYDVIKYEPCFAYTAILYLASLQMMHYLSLQMQKIDKGNLIRHQNTANAIYNQFSRVLTLVTTNLWNAKGFYRVAIGQDTLFTGAMAGNWFSHYSGFKPMLEFDKVHKMSIWLSQALVNSHKNNKYKNLSTMPLPYLEANTAGVKKAYQHRLGADYEGNYVWQSISYQACEAIYLGRIEAGLNIIKMIFDKGYYEGYPWDMNLYGRPGFVYMTHPVIWAVLPALAGMFYNAAEETIIISPKVLAGKDNIRIPAFFPKAWFMMEFNKISKSVSLTVIYSKNPEAKVEKILYRNLHGHDFRLPLLRTFIIEDGEVWKGEIPS